MEGERLQRHIRVFEDKIITAQHTFSARTFHEMMKILKSIVYVNRITSFRMLREIMHQERERAESIEENLEDSAERQIRVRERRVRVYFKWYLDFVDYLKAMKSNFDSKIHKHLLQLFYDNLEESPYGKPSGENIIAGGDGANVLKEGLTDFSALSLSTSRTDVFIQKVFRNIAIEYRVITDIYENKDIDMMASRLLRLSRKLEHLLREDLDLDSTLSRIPKPHDGKKDIGDDVLNFIHLMNYTFVKFKNLIELSKAWVDTDSRRMETLQEKLRRLKEIQKTVSRKKIDLGFAIKKHQLDIQRESENLETMLAREERVNDINAKIFDTEQTLISLKGDLEKSRDVRDVIAKDLLTIPSTDKGRFEELRQRYQKNRISRFVLYKTIKSMEYQQDILSEDLTIETDLKSSVIRCTNDIQERIEQLEMTLDEEQIQLKVLEQIYEHLKKDRQKIEGELLRQIMVARDQRNAPKNHVWGAKGNSLDWRGTSGRLSVQETEIERLGSGRMNLLDPKFSISEIDEDHSLRRTNTSFDIRSKHQVIRGVDSDPLLSRHSTMDNYADFGHSHGSGEQSSVKLDSGSGRARRDDSRSLGSAQAFWY